MNQQLAKSLILYILKPKELKQNNILIYKQIKELLKNTELVLLGGITPAPRRISDG